MNYVSHSLFNEGKGTDKDKIENQKIKGNKR